MITDKEKHLQRTPRIIVEMLDQYIIGHANAKKAVAIALRNRLRRLYVHDDLKNEISPKNILMTGPTGIGKTEIARRLASLVEAPFIKVEATKFTEVGYVGKDVESIVRDLVEDAHTIVKNKLLNQVKELAENETWHKIMDILMKHLSLSYESDTEDYLKLLEKVTLGEYDDVCVDVELPGNVDLEIMVPYGMEEVSQQLQSFVQNFQQERVNKKNLSVKAAFKAIKEDEINKLIQEADLKAQAIKLTEEEGIVFIDEIDKVLRSGTDMGDVSREGVQRDLLPLLDGTCVQTKYGNVNTDHILFIASGAFMNSDPSDMLSELQGRLPIKVHLSPLTEEDLIRILTEVKNSLINQYQALLAVENINLNFTADAINAIAKYAFILNNKNDNLGARRLQSIMEDVLEEYSFNCENYQNQNITIDIDYVKSVFKDFDKISDYSKWIL